MSSTVCFMRVTVKSALQRRSVSEIVCPVFCIFRPMWIEFGMGNIKIECIMRENRLGESQTLNVLAWRTESFALPWHSYCTNSEEM